MALRPTPRGIGALVVLAALVLLGTTAAVMNVSGDAAPEASTDGPVAAADVTGTEFTDPAGFLGETVTVSGTVSDLLTSHSFRLQDTAGNDLLVIHDADGITATGVTVEVTGVITEYDKAAVEQYLIADLPDVVYAQIDDYALAATSVGTGTTEVASTELAEDGRSGRGVATPAKLADSGSRGVQTHLVTANDKKATDDEAVASAANGGGSSGSGDTVAADGTEITYTADTSSGQYSDKTTFEATLQRDGEPVRDARIVFVLKTDGEVFERYRARTDRRGIATRTKALTDAPRDYDLVVRTREIDAKDKTTFTIERDDSDLTLVMQDGALIATLIDVDDGAGLGGRTIAFYADGRLIGRAPTDGDGTTSYEVPDRYEAGDTEFWAVFKGDDFYRRAADAY